MTSDHRNSISIDGISDEDEFLASWFASKTGISVGEDYQMYDLTKEFAQRYYHLFCCKLSGDPPGMDPISETPMTSQLQFNYRKGILESYFTSCFIKLPSASPY